jgi:hypothetical protein
MEEQHQDQQMPEDMKALVVRLQFVFMLYAGTFLGYLMSHIGDDIFINALLAGIADATANLTSGIVSKKYGLLNAYRTAAITAFVLIGSLEFFDLKGQISYFFILIAVYSVGCGLNWATATIVDQTPPAELKASMAKTVTIGATLSGTIAVGFLTHLQPLPSIGMCTALALTVLSVHFLSE